MPLIKFLAFKHTAYYFKLIVVILLLGKIMPSYSCYIKKGLMCVAIITLLGCQHSSCMEYTKLNMRSFYNIYSVSNIKYIYLLAYFCTCYNLLLLYPNFCRVLYNSHS